MSKNILLFSVTVGLAPRVLASWLGMKIQHVVDKYNIYKHIYLYIFKYIYIYTPIYLSIYPSIYLTKNLDTDRYIYI